MGSDLFRYRLDEAIREVDRELNMRARVYADRVSHGTMSRLRANSQIGLMEAVRGFLLELRELRGGDYEGTAGGQ